VSRGVLPRSAWSAFTHCARSWQPSAISPALALPDLHGLLRGLADEGVDFVVIGGVAVAVHGFVRATEDVDLVPNPERENLDRLLNALIRLGARLTVRPERTPGPDDRNALYRGANMSLSTRQGDVDVVQRLPGVPSYATLVEDALEVAPFGVPLKVASRQHLLAMKQARGSHLDLADMERLRSSAS